MTTSNNEINTDKHPDYKKRGELIDLAFTFKAANLGFSVVVRPFSRKVPVLTSDALDSIAEQLQPKLGQ